MSLLIDDVSLLHLEPVIHLDDDSGDRIITGPASADAFKNVIMRLGILLVLLITHSAFLLWSMVFF